MTTSNRARFALGQIVATPGALESVSQNEITTCLARHARGDWGDVCPADREENEFSVDKRLRLLSVFHAGNGTKFWIITEAARLMGEHGTLFAELVAHLGGRSGIDEARRYMEEGYCGEFDKLEHYAEELLDDCYGDALKSLPDFIRYHIDYEGIARDMELGGDVFTIEHGRKIHVFNANI